jgi:hypothetical protein
MRKCAVHVQNFIGLDTHAQKDCTSGHVYNSSDWRLMQTEIDIIDEALHDFCQDVLNKWKTAKVKTTVSNHSCMAIMIEKGDVAAVIAHDILSRPGGAKKVGDHVRTHLNVHGYNK